MRYGLFAIFSAATLLAGCSHGSSTVPNAAPARERANVLFETAGITRSSLWRHLSEFQRIANRHPGPDGHGNRDTGTAGYKASVDYVAGLTRQAGYNVTIQSYPYASADVTGTPVLRTVSRSFQNGSDWFVARGSGGGNITASVQPPIGSGCNPDAFQGFVRGNVALVEAGECAADAQVLNARNAGASAAILYAPEERAYPARLSAPADIPVAGVAKYSVGAALLHEYAAGQRPQVHIEIQTRKSSGIDYNVIAESPYGDANHTVVVDAHLDSIFGAGMLDNASGSTTILEIALNMAKTPTHNRLRYIWFGGEERGLLGSHYYTTHLSPVDLHRIAFDVDADVTATPNFHILVADPAYAWNVKKFPPNVVPQSRIGNDAFADYFRAAGVISRNARFGNDGTDSNSFSLVGVPNTGILTGQDCCKSSWEKNLWGGFLGNYEGKIPSYNGGCVDAPNRWCDNLPNNDPFVLELTSKAVAYVTLELANDPSLGR